MSRASTFLWRDELTPASSDTNRRSGVTGRITTIPSTTKRRRNSSVVPTVRMARAELASTEENILTDRGRPRAQCVIERIGLVIGMDPHA